MWMGAKTDIAGITAQDTTTLEDGIVFVSVGDFKILILNKTSTATADNTSVWAATPSGRWHLAVIGSSVQSWAIIAPDNLSATIDPSKYPNGLNTVGINIIVPDPLSIPFFGGWTMLSAYVPNNEYTDNGLDLYGAVTDYPTEASPHTLTLLGGATTLEFSVSNEFDFKVLKILSIDFNTNTFVLGGGMLTGSAYSWYPPSGIFDVNGLATINIVIPDYLTIPNYQNYSQIRLLAYYDNGTAGNNLVDFFSSSNYPTNDFPSSVEILSTDQDYFMFILDGNSGTLQLQPLSFSGNTLSLGVAS